MAASFETILLSRPFKFLIGSEQVEIMVHEEAIASQSPALKTLISGEMSEGKTGIAKWADVDQATFARFSQFTYTGDYSVPKMTVSGKAQGEQIQEEAWLPSEDDWQSGPKMFSKRDTPSSSRKSKKGRGDIFGETSQSTQTEAASTFNKSHTYLLQPRSQFADSCNPEVIYGPKENITEAILAHSSLYILAEKWGVGLLKKLTLFKLDRTLGLLHLNLPIVPHIVELVRHVYTGTPDLDRGIDDLRELVCKYVAANVKVMSEHKTFEELIEEGGAFVRDIWKRVLPRVG